jgi:hypothetical protein
MRWCCVNGVWQDGAGRPLETCPVQVLSSDRRVPRELAEEAYKEYAAQYGISQTLDRLCERGGFSTTELMGLLFDRIKRLEGK